MAREYTHEEVDAILRRAIERQEDGEDRLSHDDLVAAAREVGIDPASVDAAVREVDEEGDRVALVRVVKERRRKRFLRGLLSYAVVITFLFVMSQMTGGGWSIWVALGWGLAIALRALRTFAPSAEQVERDVSREERRRRRQSERAQRQARRRRQQQTARELEAAVEQGVTALLGAFGQLGREPDTRSAPSRRPSRPSGTPRVRAEERASDDDEEVEVDRGRGRGAGRDRHHGRH